MLCYNDDQVAACGWREIDTVYIVLPEIQGDTIDDCSGTADDRLESINPSAVRSLIVNYVPVDSRVMT